MAPKKSRQRSRLKKPVSRDIRHRDEGTPPPTLARSWVPKRLRPFVFLAAGVYLLSLFLNVAAKGLPSSYLPPALLYFVQTTRLFPTASQAAIDYRLEVWDCDSSRFREIEAARYFPMHPKDKENRFHRIGHFYRQHRTVMRALEHYIVKKENSEMNLSRVGGIRVSSLRIRFSEPGGPVVRWAPKPMSEYFSEQIKHWYYTRNSRKRAFCEGQDPDQDGAS